MDLPEQDAQRGALAGAVMAEQAKDFAALYLERESVQRGLPLEGLFEFPQFDHGEWGHSGVGRREDFP
jgi:hypothetical protein